MPVHDQAKKAIPVRLSQHTIYCGMGPKTPKVSLVIIEIGAFMCKIWHLVRQILLTIIRKFWPSVVHPTDTADFISQNST